MAELQRLRLLQAALEEASERGCAGTSVAAIVARARVSRKTFYALFDGRDDCLEAVFEESVAHIAGVVAPAYEGEGNWSERLGAALATLLALLESERDIGAFALEQIVVGGSMGAERRARVLERLCSVVEEGRSQAKPRHELSPLAAEVVVGGVLKVIHARLHRGPRCLSALVNPLMWMIVLPYLGPAAAASELRRTPPKPAATRSRLAAKPSKPARGPLEGLDMRVTYRTSMVLAAIAEQPGASNVEISARVDVTDQGQISKLLARLAGRGLIENTRRGHPGAANAWRLTPRGKEVDLAIGRRFARGCQLRSSSRR
jgi:AcrR family transcriptional regulator